MATFDIDKLSAGLAEIDAALRFGKPRQSELERIKLRLDEQRRFLDACQAHRREIEALLNWQRGG